MSKIDIERLEPGLGMDVLLAEKVMEWWNCEGIWCAGEQGSVGTGTGYISEPITEAAFQYALGGREYGEYTPEATLYEDAQRCVWRPSSDIAHASLIHKAACQWGGNRRHKYLHALAANLQAGEGPQYQVAWPYALIYISPMAICRAALKVIVG